MTKPNTEPHGIQWSLTQWLEDLDFADDIYLLAHIRTDIEIKLRRLKKYASQVGLKINVGKTKLLRLNTNALCEFAIKGELIDEVEKFATWVALFHTMVELKQMFWAELTKPGKRKALLVLVGLIKNVFIYF